MTAREKVMYSDLLRVKALGKYPYILVRTVPQENGDITLEFEAGNMGDDPPRTHADFAELLHELADIAQEYDNSNE